jgi:hypothetical protein
MVNKKELIKQIKNEYDISLNTKKLNQMNTEQLEEVLDRKSVV